MVICEKHKECTTAKSCWHGAEHDYYPSCLEECPIFPESVCCSIFEDKMREAIKKGGDSKCKDSKIKKFTL